MEPPISPPVLAPVTGPRYRYFLKPPSVVSLRAGDLLGEVPDSARARGFVAERMIELPASEIFQGPVPRISLDRLAEIAPECFRATGFQTFVRLPAGKLARGYHLVSDRELLPEEKPPYTPPPELIYEQIGGSEPDASAASAEESLPAPEASEPSSFEEAAPEQTQRLTPLRVPEPISFKPSGAISPPPAADSVPEPSAPLPAEAPAPKAAVPFRSPATFPKESASLRPLQAPVQPSEPAAVPEPQLPVAKRPFSVLPLFRRKSGETQKASVTPSSTAPQVPPPPRRRIELPPPRVIAPPVAPVEEPLVQSTEEPTLPPVAEVVPETYPEAIEATPIPEEPPLDEPVEEKASVPLETVIPEPPPEPVAQDEPEPLPEPVFAAPLEPEPVIPEPKPEPAVVARPMMVTQTEHVAKASAQLTNQDDLQALFMTEETLTVDRIVELCGALPGINSCVLSHGAAVIASHNVPDSIDLISLSAHALEMLGSMRASSARMGIGAIPAVTLHSEKGPITFFHREDLCLLVLHKDRGFVPGVREKLQRVVDELSQARLPRPLPSKPRTLPAE